MEYLVQVILFQAVFLGVYDLILKRETFFQWNRIYLIITLLLAYLLPLLKFNTVQENIPQGYMVMLPEVISSPVSVIEQHIDWSALLFTGMRWIFFTGVVVAGTLFIYKLVQLFKIIHQNKNEINKEYNLVLLPDNGSAFSFFRYIFIGRRMPQKEHIITHELVHVKQKHSIDLMLFEIQKILFWFNPFSYFFQNRISEIHEFIADSKSVSKGDKSTYFHGLLAQVFQIEKFAFVNSFYKKSIIKKRIIMLGKNKSKEIFKFKYLLVIPLLMGMVIYTSCNKNSSNTKEIAKVVLEKYSMNISDNEVIPNFRYFDKYESLREFLDNNPNYLVWIDTDKNGNQILEVHHENETPPDGFVETSSKFNTGSSNIKMYYNSKNFNRNNNSKLEEVSFGQIDQVPVFPGCEDAEDQKKCFTDKIIENISEHFDTSITKTLDLLPGKKRVYVMFTIDKKGKIVDIKARGPHKALEAEGIRVINNLPQMQPGKHNGKTVNVKFTLPINVVVE